MVILLIFMVLMKLIHLNLKQNKKKQKKKPNKQKCHIGDIGKIDNVEIKVLLKYLSNFWKTLKMSLINCEVEFFVKQSSSCVIIYADVTNQNSAFIITETNLYVPVVTLSTQNNEKLLPQLKLGFKRTISWNIYLSKPELLPRDSNLNTSIEPSFQGFNRIFVLAF